MTRAFFLNLAVLLMMSWASACADSEVGDLEQVDQEVARSQVVLLGTGTPNADPERSGPALAVVVNQQAYLVDCGAGVVRRAAAARRNGIGALGARKLRHVFITHLHSDHTLGYPDLIITPWILGRRALLQAYGPPGLAEMTQHILEAYQEDIQIRIRGLESGNTTGYRVDVQEISAGLVYQDENVRVTAFPVQHGSWLHAFGFRFDAADRSIVISGDTAPSASLIKHAKGCDVLVHQVYSEIGFERLRPKLKRYYRAFHTSTAELAEIARQVQPELLVLTHQLSLGRTPEELVAEIQRTYHGEVRSGRDLGVY
jgi:ribonuclease BN (tRNA processing enzyme)